MLDLDVPEHAQVAGVNEFVALLNSPACYACVHVVQNRVRANKASGRKQGVARQQLLATLQAE